MKNVFYFKGIILIYTIFFILSCKKEQPADSAATPNDAKALENTQNDAKFRQFEENWNSLSIDDKSTITSFVFDEYFKKIEGKSRSVVHGGPIFKNKAIKYTQNFYEEHVNPQDSMKRDTLSKSVYFTASEIVDFIRTLESSCPSGPLGLRFYFAKYHEKINGEDLKHQYGLILRGVCNYEDIPHTPNEETTGLKVSRNYGDVCPPVCDDTSIKYKKAEYASGTFTKFPR